MEGHDHGGLHADPVDFPTPPQATVAKVDGQLELGVRAVAQQLALPFLAESFDEEAAGEGLKGADLEESLSIYFK